jgi:hypothetical protein
MDLRTWLSISCHISDVTPANAHDSQMLPRLLDPENEHDYVWADSAYSGECFESLLSRGGSNA